MEAVLDWIREPYRSFYGPPDKVRERNIQIVRTLVPGILASERQAEAALDEAEADDAIKAVSDLMERKWQVVKRCRALVEAMLKGEVCR